MGVPRPVRGSQPAFAGKPFVPHPGLSPANITVSIRTATGRIVLELTGGNIVESAGVRVEQRVQETERALASCKQVIV